MLVGYARVSTDEQNLHLQTDALARAGCERIFCDEGISGIAISRPALDQALSSLRSGDMLVIWKLDRLGRSLAHLMGVTDDLAARNIGFQSLCEAIDTASASGRLLFQIMGAIAEFERALIAERTRAGMASAKRRGSTLGRPSKLSEHDILLARHFIEAGSISMRELAASHGIAPITLARALKRLRSS